jgi:hypothetical protein
MNSDTLIKEYFLSQMNLKIHDINTFDNSPSKELIEGIINELSAQNLDGENTDHILNTAQQLKFLQEDSNTPQKIKENIDNKGPDADLMIDALIDWNSLNFSRNTNLNDYLKIMNDESVSKLSFSVDKEDYFVKKTGRKQNYASFHFYSLERNANLKLYLSFVEYKEQVRTPDKKYIEFTLQEEGIKPSSTIKDNLQHAGEVWPNTNHSHTAYADSDRLSQAISRRIPNLYWESASLMKGDFSSEFWTLFISILGKDNLIANQIQIFESYKNLITIEQKFAAPTGEFVLRASKEGNEKAWPNYSRPPTIKFSYIPDTQATSRIELKLDYACFRTPDKNAKYDIGKYEI